MAPWNRVTHVIAHVFVRATAVLALLSLAACSDDLIGETESAPFIVYCDVQMDFTEPLTANGTDRVRVLARVHDGSGHVLPGRTVEFTAVGAGCAVQPPGPLLTDALGVAQTALTATQPGSKGVIVHVDRGTADEVEATSASVEFGLPGR